MIDAFGFKIDDKTALVIGAGVVILAYWSIKKTAQGVSDIAEAVNPLNNNNIFYRGTNEAGAVITGDNNFSLGVWLYDALHPDQSAGASVIKLPTQGGGATGSW